MHHSVVALACVPSVVLRQHLGPSFAFYQPFVGGDAYIACQVLGYLAIAVSLVVQTSVFYVRPSSDLFGRLTVVGLLMAVGQVMLMLSVDLFSTGGEPTGGQLSPRRFENKKLLRRDTWVVVLLLVGYHVPVPALGAFVPEFAKLSMVTFVASHLLCSILIHVRLGWMLTPGYRLILSWPAGWKFVIAQSLAWAGYLSPCLLRSSSPRLDTWCNQRQLARWQHSVPSPALTTLCEHFGTHLRQPPNNTADAFVCLFRELHLSSNTVGSH